MPLFAHIFLPEAFVLRDRGFIQAPIPDGLEGSQKGIFNFILPQIQSVLDSTGNICRVMLIGGRNGREW